MTAVSNSLHFTLSNCSNFNGPRILLIKLPVWLDLTLLYRKLLFFFVMTSLGLNPTHTFLIRSPLLSTKELIGQWNHKPQS